MNIPFKLNIFKQIELYQDLRSLDRQFKRQLKECKGKICLTPPLWFFVKKILHWSYLRHKHLGSAIKLLRQVDTWYTHLNCTNDEFDNIQIRKVYGWMESYGLAKFFKDGENNYYNINQNNCDGIFLTTKAVDYSVGIYEWYKFGKVKGDYKKIKGAEKVLYVKWTDQIKFFIYMLIAVLIILGSIFFFFSKLFDSLIILYYGN